MLEILRTRHDNNHVLNSLYLHLVGDGAPLYLYRLFAVVCGIASLWVIAHIARRWGHAEALYSVILVATSFPLLVYFSEARGYAPAMLFGLVVGASATTIAASVSSSSSTAHHPMSTGSWRPVRTSRCMHATG